MCCALLCVHSSIAVILMGRRELVALVDLSSLCLVMVEQLFLVVQRGCLQFVIVVFPDHTHLLSFRCCLWPCSLAAPVLPGGFMVLWFYVQELPKAQPAVVLVLKRLRRRGYSLSLIRQTGRGVKITKTKDSS